MKLQQRQPHCIAGHVDEGDAAAGAQETGAPALHPHHLSGSEFRIWTGHGSDAFNAGCQCLSHIEMRHSSGMRAAWIAR